MLVESEHWTLSTKKRNPALALVCLMPRVTVNVIDMAIALGSEVYSGCEHRAPAARGTRARKGQSNSSVLFQQRRADLNASDSNLLSHATNARQLTPDKPTTTQSTQQKDGNDTTLDDAYFTALSALCKFYPKTSMKRTHVVAE